MKTMRILIPVIAAFMFVFFSSSLFAQTDIENHTQLSNLNKAIITHTNAIALGEAKTKNDQVTHYNEYRKSLAEAKKTHNLLKKIIPSKAISEAIIHHDNIDKYYATTTAHANSMLEELKNEKPDDTKMKERAKKIHDAVEMSEKDHQALIKDTH